MKERAINTQLGGTNSVIVLAIGDPDEWCNKGNPLPSGSQGSFLSFHELTAGALAHYQPTIVISPVLAHGFDCVEMAALLSDLEFEGIYRAYASNLPKPDVIEREVRQHCQTFTFEIVEC
jgi:hypothetical protein